MTTPRPKINYATIQSRDAQVIAGIQKRLENDPPIVLAGVSYTAASMTALYQSQLNAITAVATATAQRTSAIQAYKALTATVDTVTPGLRDYLRQTYNNAPEVLADFGMTPKKAAAKRDPVTNVVAAARNAATRKARHTEGPKAKLETKAVVSTADIASQVAARISPSAPEAGSTPSAAGGGSEPALLSTSPGVSPVNAQAAANGK
jgi:hypothetical protein